ncbi:hypothetical protein [Candidatus Solirubrobacter pratensis]|uniref:hypothetical protein n=1 Tax=Candidatus Solirubrobacter pratensis TaxID=1298857 RepID=UPI00041A0F91|nr:hypothetical protein [Candidatus Solirubrobacter pratensis]
MSKREKDEGDAVADEHVRLSTHPEAVASVKRMRARCGLAGFAVVLVLCLMAGVPAFDATFRALIAGVVAHLAGWYVSIAVWRQVIRQQASQAAEAYNARIRKARQDAADRAAAALSAQQAAEAEAQASWSATIGR